MAHERTTLGSVGLAIAEHTVASGQDVLLAMVIGYEAAGRIGDARAAGRPEVHASQIVAFGGAFTAAKVLKLTDEQMAHHWDYGRYDGRHRNRHGSWAREYMGAYAPLCAVGACCRAWLHRERRHARWTGRLRGRLRRRQAAIESLTVDLGKDWDIVQLLAIKLWPGTHPFSGTVEAAVNAACDAHVPPQEVAKILAAGPNRTTIAAAGGRGSGRGDTQPAVPRRVGGRRQRLHLGPRDGGQDLQPVS